MSGVSKIFITNESDMFVLKITTLNENFGLLSWLAQECPGFTIECFSSLETLCLWQTGMIGHCKSKLRTKAQKAN